MNKIHLRWAIIVLVLIGALAAAGYYFSDQLTHLSGKLAFLNRQMQTGGEQMVGKATHSKGRVIAQLGNNKRFLSANDPIFQGDRIATQAHARLVIKMQDGAVVALGENTEFIVQQYQYDQKQDLGKGLLELAKGFATVTSGRIAQLYESPFQVVTPVATLGVRGTQLWARVYFENDKDGKPAPRLQTIAIQPTVVVSNETGVKELTQPNLGLQVEHGKQALANPLPVSLKVLAQAQLSVAIPQPLNQKQRQQLQASLEKHFLEKGVAPNAEMAKKLAAQVIERAAEDAEWHMAKKAADRQAEKLLDEVKKKGTGALGEASKAFSGEELRKSLEKTATDASYDKVFKEISEQVSLRATEQAQQAPGQNYNSEVEFKEFKLAPDPAPTPGTPATTAEGMDATAQMTASTQVALDAPYAQEATAPGARPADTTTAPTTPTGLPGAETTTSPAGHEAGTPVASTPGADTGAPTQPGVVATPTDTPMGAGTASSPESTEEQVSPSKTTSPQTGSATTETTPGITTVDTTPKAQPQSQQTTATTPTTTPAATTANHAPVVSNGSGSVSEQAPNGTAITTVSASDADGHILTYSITAGNGGGVFAINASSGAITVANGNGLDYESVHSYTLTVRAVDPGGLSGSGTITIAVTNINEAPTLADSTLTVAEHTATGQTVGQLSAVDPDSGDTFNYEILTGNERGLFYLDSPTGTITVANGPNLDYESYPTTTLGVRVTDAGGLSAEAAVTINLTNINDPPAIGNAAFSIAENSANGTSVGSVTTSDPDVGDTRSFAITGGNTGSAFAINSSGLISVATGSVLDYETTPTFTLTVTATDSGGLTASGTVTITLTNVNEPPLASDAAFSVAENSALGTSVGTVTATDVDAGDTRTFAITAGNTNSAFAINASSGAITVATSSALDYESLTSFSLTVTVTDAGGLSDTATVTITVTNVNEAPTINGDTFSIPENSANATAVGSVTASDPDAGDSISSYAITAGNTGNAFTINASSGAISVATSAVLDYETTPTFTLTVTATDSGGLTGTGTVVVNLTPVNEFAPVINDAATTLAENSANGASVYTVTATDADSGDSFTYAINAQSVAGTFSINAASGVISVANSAVLNFEVTPSFTVTVQVTDSGALTDTAVITINLTNVNEAPTANDAVFTVAELSAVGTAVGSVVATDPDAGDVLTYAITAGNTGNAFTINAASGAITVATSAAVAFASSPFTLTVTATDVGGLSDPATITVTVTSWTCNSIAGAPTVATMLANGKTKYQSTKTALQALGVGGTLVLSEDELEEMIIAKANQQITGAGGDASITDVTTVVKKFDVQLTAPAAPYIGQATVMMEIGLINAVYNRLSAIQNNAANANPNNLDYWFQVLGVGGNYAGDYTACVRMVLNLTNPAAGQIGFDDASSTVEVRHELPTIYTAQHPITLNYYFRPQELITSYNAVRATLAAMGSPIKFFTGTSASNASQSIPSSQGFDYYFPGLISTITVNNNSVTLTK